MGTVTANKYEFSISKIWAASSLSLRNKYGAEHPLNATARRRSGGEDQVRASLGDRYRQREDTCQLLGHRGGLIKCWQQQEEEAERWRRGGREGESEEGKEEGKGR